MEYRGYLHRRRRSLLRAYMSPGAEIPLQNKLTRIERTYIGSVIVGVAILECILGYASKHM